MDTRMLQLYQLTITQTVVLLTVLLVLGRLVQVIRNRRNSPLTLLSGPPSTNIFWGRLLEIIASNDIGPLCEEWANKHGPVFKIPAWFGSSQVILCDSKAIAHFHAADNSKYVRPPFINKFQRLLVGDSMSSAEPADHHRLRRILTPAFSIAALRELKGVFFDSTYRVKGQWDALFESNHEIVVDVQQWMHRMTLDVIGIAGFGHDFKAGNGDQSAVTEAYDAIYKIEDPQAYQYFYLLGLQFPQIVNLPLKSAKIYHRLRGAFRDIAFHLLDSAGTTNETSVSDTVKDRSIIGSLLKGKAADAKSGNLSLEEVVGQISLLLFAGYETTAISISWGLIELARHPHVQDKLREELHQFSNSDPTWDQLMSGLPYLDAVVREALRLHPPADMIIRVASEDDIVPLSAPMEATSGEVMEQIHIPKGTVVISPIRYFNCCEATWGPDAREFVPERWLKENTEESKEGGTKRLYTFSDGPRSCIGKIFAMAEFKAAFSILVRNFSFELLDGQDTNIEVFKPRLPPRPKVAGEVGSPLPMRIKQVSG